MKLFTALSVLMLSTMASAQTTAPTVDPTLMQTGYIRLQNGDFETVAAKTREFLNLDPITSRQILDPLTGKPEIDHEQAYLFDARTPFVKSVGGGANYSVLADQTLVVFSSTWDKPIRAGKMNFEVETYGGNFMIKKTTHEIVTVSATGLVRYNLAGNMGTGVIAPTIRLVGGNYFIDVNNELWTINAKGEVYHVEEIGNPGKFLKFPLAYLPGGNFFYQQDGLIVPIPSTGYPLQAFPGAKPQVLGGNYYIGTDGYMYSFRYDGISFKNEKSLGRVKNVGYSYVTYENGMFLVVDGMGIVHQNAIRVSTTKNNYQNITSFRDAIDPVSVWTPNTSRR